ncbi:hypothetical protein GR183_19280 [Stappia sp. GBMRC 2046]|uniref:Uncharacterized protein n=1 Tax=Stappia sediminis TaxID=2692190 RepID=A0A7X3LXU4_9HYPH|nr:hypothetical protein [Stappia sediminis]MXN67058.1 hypothetical protein [Stappia sediminis]
MTPIAVSHLSRSLERSVTETALMEPAQAAPRQELGYLAFPELFAALALA